jgi:hypothetical protein
MRTSQLFRSSLVFLSAAIIPGAVGYGLALGRFDTDLAVLAALAIAGCAGYAMGRGIVAEP